MTGIKQILIIGLGNTLLSDDGVGIYVVREIRKLAQRSDVAFHEASVGGLELLDLIAGYERVIIIDAFQTGQREVGSLLELRPEDLAGGSAMTRHQVSLPEALELGRQLGVRIPAEVKIYGIEVADSATFHEQCTPVLQKRIPEIAREIIQRERLPV